MEESQVHDNNKSKIESNISISTTWEEWEEPLTEKDLEAIDKAFEAAATCSSLPKKRPSTPLLNDAVQQDHSKTARRQLPNSILALQHTNAFSLLLCRQANTRMRYPVMNFGGKITYSRTTVEVEKAAMEVLKTVNSKKNEIGQYAVGFDIEWKPTFRKGVPPGKVAVVQMCGDTKCCHVMHIIHSGIPRSLQLLLESSSILKVGAGIANDAVKFFKDYNVSIKGVEDLSYLANQKLGGDARIWGLASLTEKLVCKQLLKPNKIRLGNWEAKFLSKDQQQYASTDAFASWYLYEVLRSLPDVEKVAAENPSEEQVVSCNKYHNI